MKEIPEPTLQGTIRDTCGWLAVYGVCLAFGWIFHDDMQTAIQWPAITMFIGFLGSLSCSLPIGIITLLIIAFALVYGYPEYFGVAVGFAALFTPNIGVALGVKCGCVLRRTIHRRRSTTGQNPDSSGVEDGTTESSQFHQIQQAL